MLLPAASSALRRVQPGQMDTALESVDNNDLSSNEWLQTIVENRATGRAIGAVAALLCALDDNTGLVILRSTP